MGSWENEAGRAGDAGSGRMVVRKGGACGSARRRGGGGLGGRMRQLEPGPGLDPTWSEGWRRPRVTASGEGPASGGGGDCHWLLVPLPGPDGRH